MVVVVSTLSCWWCWWWWLLCLIFFLSVPLLDDGWIIVSFIYRLYSSRPYYFWPLMIHSCWPLLIFTILNHALVTSCCTIDAYHIHARPRRIDPKIPHHDPPPPGGVRVPFRRLHETKTFFLNKTLKTINETNFFLTENIWNSEVGSGADCWLANLQSCPFQRRWLENDSGALPLAQGLAKEMAFAGWQVMQWFRFCNLLRSFFYMTGLVCRGHSFWHDCLAEEKGNGNLAGLELPFFFNKHEKQHFFLQQQKPKP